ncbi:hypothetical protein SAMN02745126_04433 [Enhydrobacter aerosaccus]|uniref:Uncharacterized protein n=1 Tax=Enhydrobacter aerosaccus TaxID=225324 RepID=A0A1T4S8Z5_9HYPH|nr:hypothetical protein [Enhydrobacter aerosaccus]SKA24713.1 hypothetical protein SAMN02745126_04433 [Enhydrobacter aerosaccus]
MADLDYAGLSDEDAKAVKRAIARHENFHGYIPSHSLEFIVRNYRMLASLGILEEPWIDAYMHASHLSMIGETVVRAVFDACERARLLKLKPLGDAIALGRDRRDRITLFRGCAGPVHTLGMSWTPSLDKAIWYAAKHAEYYHLDNKAVYVTTVPIKDIYCRLDHYDDDFIVYPQEVWCVDVPAKEFRLDRPR